MRSRPSWRGGGGLLTSCAGTSSSLQIAPAFVDNWHPAQSLMPKLSATSWLTSDQHPSGSCSPGIGVIQVRVAEAQHPLTLGLPERLPCVYYGPILERTGSELRALLICDAPDPERFTPGECLYGDTDLDLAQTAMARACAAGLAAAGWQEYGEGVIVGYGLHPEFGPEPSMRHWGQAARLIENAAEWMHQRHAPAPAPQPDPEMPAAVAQAVEQAQGLARKLGHAFARLATTRLEPLPPWLGTDQARAAFGLDPVAIWRLTTTTGAEGCEAMDRDLDAWRRAFETPWPQPAAASQRTEIARARARSALLLTLGNVEDEPQDLGFKALIALLEEALALTMTFEVVGAHHPYRAVAMSYLSAFGLFGAAQLVLSASQTLIDQAALIAAVAQSPCSKSRPQ